MQDHLYKQIDIPDEVCEALQHGAALAISISGGKDSQALLRILSHHPERHRWNGPVIAVHADLGRAEWTETPAHVERICREAGVELVITQRSDGADLIDHIHARMERLRGSGKPFWPSAANRYCTSDLKRTTIDAILRRYRLVISAEGVRADESVSRRRKPVCEVRSSITTKRLKGPTKKQSGCTSRVAWHQWKRLERIRSHISAGRARGLGAGGRLALNWRPLLRWAEADVWEACGTSIYELERCRALFRRGRRAEALEGWVGHPAYVYGNERLSCALCVLGSKNDLINGARHNPETFELLHEMEVLSGCSFRHNFSLADVKQAVECGEVHRPRPPASIQADLFACATAA